MKGQGQGQGQGQSQGQGQGQSQGQSQGQVDAILEYLGPLSVYAVIQWAAFAVCMIPISFQMFAIVFTGRDVPHDCSPIASKNTSLDHVTEIFWVSETGELANNATNITSSLYNVSSASMLDREKPMKTQNGKEAEDRGNNSSTVKDLVSKDSSIMSDFDLVCDKAALVGLTQMLLGVGQFVGALFLPALADHVGRKRVHIITHAFTAISGVVVAFSPTYLVLAISKVLVGMGIMGLRLTSTTAMLELFPARLRTLATAVSGGVLFALTSATIGPVAYALRFESWRTMQLVFTSASLVLILQIIFLDEPLRALLATNKHKEALKVIRKAARWNNKDMNHLQEQFSSLIQPDPPASSSPSSPTSPTKDPTMDDDLNPNECQQRLVDNAIPNNYEFRPRGDELAINEQNLSSSKTDASFRVEDGLNGNVRPLNGADLTEELKLPTESASHSRDSDVEDVVDLSMLGMKDKRTDCAVSVDSFDENGLRNQESSSCSPKSNEDVVDHSDRIEDHVGILKDGQDSGTEVSVKGHPGSQVTGSGKRRKVNIMDLLRHRRMRIHVLIACLLWFTTSLTYFGLYLISGSLAGDLYINFSLNGLVEIPTCFIILFTLDRFGRKKTLGSFQILCGVCLIGSGVCRLFEANDLAGVLSTVFFMVGKLGATAAVNITIMYTGEIFPTVCRNQSIGIASATGRTAIMLAPFASTLAQHFPWAPGLVLGGLSLLSVCCLFFVPETAGRELPQTVDDLDRWFHREEEDAAAVEAQAEKSV